MPNARTFHSCECTFIGGISLDRALSDRLALDDLLTAYAVAIDSDAIGDLTGLATGDAVFDYTSSGGPRGSVPEVQEWLTKALGFVPIRAHLIVNRRFAIADGADGGAGDEATAEAHFFNPMSVRMPGGDGATLWNPGGGYYSVAFRRTAEGWRISELVMRETWRVAVPVQDSRGGH
jgi:hypothetical protein